jgi:hypothetical protein
MRQALRTQPVLTVVNPSAPPKISRMEIVDPGFAEAIPTAIRARQLFQEAKALSLEHVRALGVAIDAVREISGSIAQDGDLYSPGIRDLAERLAEDLLWKSKSLEQLVQTQAGQFRTS